MPIGTGGTLTGGGGGAQGSQGNQGAGGGAQGAQGAQGSTGTQGAQGTQGAGSQGAQGVQGAAGAQGNQGSQGSTGAQGLQGNQGNQGFQGFQGFQGAQGTAGTATGIGTNHQSFNGSNSGTTDYYEMVNATTGGKGKWYILILNDWSDSGTTITYTTAFSNDVPFWAATAGIPSAFVPVASKTTFQMPSTSSGCQGTFQLWGS